MPTKEQQGDTLDTKSSRRRREKPQLSCNLCRQKKLKCDRNQPCKNCEKRPLGSCVYVQSSLATKIKISESNDQISVQDRINRLEDLVSSLAASTSGEPTGLNEGNARAVNFQDPVEQVSSKEIPGSADKVAKSTDHLMTDKTATRYSNPSHWEAILEDITELKDALAMDQATETESVEDHTKDRFPTLLLGERKMVSLMDVICSLPPKPVFDEIMNLFVKSVDIPTFTCHVPTLLREYESFWEDPTSPNVSLPFLAMLLATAVMTLQFATRAGASITGLISSEYTASILTTQAAELLMLSDYTKPTKWTVEAMIVYVAAEHFRSNSDFRISLLFGVVYRLAVRAGYHREPGHFSQLSVFERELRRRTWALIAHFDLVIAFACGLPPLIDERKVDVLQPGNYLDEDLHPDMISLPAPRPIDEQTWTGYLVFKLKSLRMLAKVMDRANEIATLTYSEVMAIDAEITDIFAHRPAYLQMPAGQIPRSLSPSTITRLCFVDLVASRARIILHRRFLIAARINEAFRYSRQVCLVSATTALAYQNEVHSLSKSPLGLMAGNWRFFTLMAHDFALAAMILCVDIDQDLLRCKGNLDDLPTEERESVGDRINLIATAYNIWSNSLTTTAEGKRVARVLRIVLQKTKQAQVVKHGSTEISSPASFPADFNASGDTIGKFPDVDFEATTTNETWNIPFPRQLNPRDGIPQSHTSTATAITDVPGTDSLASLSQATAVPAAADNSLPTELGVLTNLDIEQTETDFDWTEWDQCFGSSALEF